MRHPSFLTALGFDFHSQVENGRLYKKIYNVPAMQQIAPMLPPTRLNVLIALSVAKILQNGVIVYFVEMTDMRQSATSQAFSREEAEARLRKFDSHFASR